MPELLRKKRTYVDEPQKPFFRGRLHQFAFFFALVAGGYTIKYCEDQIKKMAMYVYVMSTLCLYAVSTTTHTLIWHDKRLKLWIQKLDHIAIIIQIAGTYTPVCFNNLPRDKSWPMVILASVWNLSLLGIFKALYWDNPPKLINVAYYFLVGMSIVPYMPKVMSSIPIFEYVSFALGGLIYLYGGLTYGLEWPDPYPSVFGFHEIFHLCTITANTLFYLPLARVSLSNDSR
jgi:hemolysin III